MFSVEDKKRWRQLCPLPEDMLLFRMNAVKEANNLSQINLNAPKKDMSDYLQVTKIGCFVNDKFSLENFANPAA